MGKTRKIKRTSDPTDKFTNDIYNVNYIYTVLWFQSIYEFEKF